MSFGSSSTSTSDSKVLTLQVSQSSAGLAMPLVWGTNKLPANLLWYSDFVATPHTQSQGGKGGGGGQTSTSYTYSSAFVLGLCAGQIAGVRKVWKDKTTTTPAALGFEVHTGALGQPVWSYLSSKHADEAIGYSGIAYLAASAFDLGSDTSPPSLSFEIQGRSIISGADDAEPADVIADIASDALIGVGVQSAQIAELTDYRTWCKAMGFRLSPAVDSQTAASSVVTDILTASYADSVWSEGKLKIIPYGDSAVTGNGVTWTPNVTPVYDLTEDHFLDTEQPIKITRKRVSDAYNSQKVEYLDRANDYNTAVAEASDLAAIDRFGPRPASVKTLHCICQQSIAETVAAAWNARETNIRNTYEFKVDCRFGRLEPMDIVTLTHARLGMNRVPVRIVDTDTDEDNDITITAEEWPFGVAAPARIASQSGSGYIPDMNVSAGNANTPVIFEPPVSLAGEPEIWIGTAGGANWGGAEVWVSLDGNTYSAVGKITAPARHGLTTAAFAAGGDPDNTNTLSVDLSASAGALLPGTAAERDMFQTLVYVGGELVAYQGATLTGANRYDLTNLRRGAYGTPITAHSVGAAVLRCDDAVFRYPYDPALVGKTIYIKLRSFNKTGAGYQDLAAVQASAYTVVGAPLGAVAGLVLARPFTGKTLSVTWSAYSGASSYTVEIWSAGAKCKTVKGLASTAFEIDIAGLKAAGCGRSVEVRVYAVAANGQSSTAAVLVAAKAQIAAPTVAAADSGGAVQVTCTKPSDESYSGTRIWVQSASGFNPASTTPSYDGPNTMFDTGRLAAGGTYYVRAACYDAFGADSLNYTSEVAVTIMKAVDGVATVSDATTITAAAGSNPPGGDAYWAVYDAATKQMARWDSAQGKYVFAVKASDITGAIQQAQLDATLSSRINLIDAPATTAGSVAAQIAAEAAARGTAVSNEQTARQQGDAANASSINTITARLTGSGDIATAIAAAQSTATAAASAGSANASSINAVAARLDSGDIHTSIASVTTTANAAATQAGNTASALSATWQVQVDAGGKVAGLKAYSTGATSGFVISADKVLIGDLTNFCPNGMGASTDGWGGNVRAVSFSWSTYNSAVTVTTALRFGARDSTYGNMFPVKPGDKFYASMDTLPGGAGANTYPCRIGLRFLDGSKNVVSWTGGASREISVSGYSRIEGSLTAPAGVVFADVWIQIDGPGGTDFADGAGAFYATNMVIRRMNGSELIVDGGITANKLSADAVNAVSVTAQNAVFTKIAAASLSALTGSLGTLNVSGWLYINGDGGSSWGGIRTSGKTWDGDGVDGFVVYRNSSDGSLHYEVKAGNNRISMTPGYADINFSNNFHVDNSGTVTMQSASSGARRVMTNSADRYYDASGVLRIEITV